MGKIKIIGNLFTLIFAGSEVYTTFAAANTGVAQLVEHRSPKPGYLTAEERRYIFNALLAFRNRLIAQGRYTDAVDEVMIKFAK